MREVTERDGWYDMLLCMLCSEGIFISETGAREKADQSERRWLASKVSGNLLREGRRERERRGLDELCVVTLDY